MVIANPAPFVPKNSSRENTVFNPRGKHMSNRSFAFFSDHRAAVAMDEQDLGDGNSRLTFALALCNNRDQFNRRTARNILNGRINDRLAGNPTRLTFQENYRGTHSRRDAMARVMDAMRELPESRDYTIIRNFKSTVASKMASLRIAQEEVEETLEGAMEANPHLRQLVEAYEGRA
jgi:hypothetical protein